MTEDIEQTYMKTLATKCVKVARIQYIRDEIINKRNELLDILRVDAKKDEKQAIELEKVKKMVEELNVQDNKLTARIEESIIQHGEDTNSVQLESCKCQQGDQISEQKPQQVEQQKAEKLKLLREKYEAKAQALQEKYDKEKQFRQKKLEHESFLIMKSQNMMWKRREMSRNIEEIYRTHGGVTIDAELKVLKLQHEWREFENQHYLEVEKARRQFELVELEFATESDTE
jgi:hypothetical protein